MGYDGEYTKYYPYNESGTSVMAGVNVLESVVRDGLVFSTFNPILFTSAITVYQAKTHTGQNAVIPNGNSLTVFFDGVDAGTHVSQSDLNITSNGLVGWVDGNYDITLYSLYFKDILQDHDRLKTMVK